MHLCIEFFNLNSQTVLNEKTTRGSSVAMRSCEKVRIYNYNFVRCNDLSLSFMCVPAPKHRRRPWPLANVQEWEAW